MSIRWHPVDDDAIAHVHDAVEIGGGFGVVSNHDDGLTEIFVELAEHLQDDFGIL